MSATFRSFAKINLHLQVIGRRGDGYHELRTVFQTIDLHDLLHVDLAGTGLALEVVGSDAVPGGPENLAWRAAAAFQEAFGGPAGIRLTLEKRIPAGGGLGGGSSDAATVLLALRELVGRPARRLDLWELARSLGADVPYFLCGGTALGVGRGDEIVPLPELPDGGLWLVLPPFGVSTREVFMALPVRPPAPLAASVLALAAGEIPRAPTELAGWNDLEPAALAVAPALATLCDTLRSSGVHWLRMSGSGATLLADFEPRCESAVRAALPAGVRLERVRTLSRRGVEAAWRG